MQQQSCLNMESFTTAQFYYILFHEIYLQQIIVLAHSNFDTEIKAPVTQRRLWATSYHKCWGVITCQKLHDSTDFYDEDISMTSAS